MNLVIQAHTLKNEPLSQPITGRFDERGGTIGRSDTNTLALPDPERHISRLHAEVWFSNGAFSIRNVGSANAILVNGRQIVPGEGSALGEGDELVIGSYALRVSANVPSQLRPSPVDGRTVIRASATEFRTNPPQPRRAPAGAPAAPVLAPPTVSPLEAGPAAAAFGAPAASASDPFADLFATPAPSAGSSDPFADLLGPATPSPAPRAATPPAPAPRLPPPAAPPPPAPLPPVAARLPDDFDPFADPTPPPAPRGATPDAFPGFGTAAQGEPFGAPAPASAAPVSGGAFGDLFGTAPPAPGASLDDLFGLPAATPPGHDPLAAFMAPSAAPGGRAPSQDPLAMFQAGPAAGVPVAAPGPDHTPELRGAYRPPAVRDAPAPTPVRAAPIPPAPAPAPRPVSAARGAAPPRLPPFPPDPAETTMPAMRVSRPAPGDLGGPTSSPMPFAPPAGTAPAMAPRSDATLSPANPPDAAAPTGAAMPADTAALWAAFCDGAGISVQPPQGLNPALMRVIGEVLRHSVDGTLKLMAVRAAAKQELRAQVTTIQSRNNNPLKFSPDASAAIEQLLQPPMRGFMVGPQAVNDAMDDLVGHAIGTMAGMRAALEGVLSRFEPAQLEAKLGGGSVMDTLLPMNRRAKLWELYLQHFKRIQGDATEDFHELFGRAFVRAYEDQLDRLDRDRHPDV